MKQQRGKLSPRKSIHILIFAWAFTREVKTSISERGLDPLGLSGGSRNSLKNSYNYNFGCSLVRHMSGNYPVDFNNGESANNRETQIGKERP